MCKPTEGQENAQTELNNIIREGTIDFRIPACECASFSSAFVLPGPSCQKLSIYQKHGQGENSRMMSFVPSAAGFVKTARMMASIMSRLKALPAWLDAFSNLNCITECTETVMSYTKDGHVVQRKKQTWFAQVTPQELWHSS